ncbi:MAG: flagellar biosynthetic protein FliO [Bradyrhizobium sp.]|uniref:flagellar biosynthetic protein FliO n=1 Tax=Bradyrhizobium sp. TaxID=376 RepID=UPI001C283A3E|nr:flagellar biosynthetic protein FliO [Bradyrhizobium sp.]MBU6462277.1 flagellar biosynthetic protein FliO [Pseudomonadota bacterium]MDE2067330.1 flagellar biosynthetic protein FliO [Bradyrhizobium sp.]MDE2242534.1 flagellar biosynthetic protein FliO [Bradyrhizobium sp.]MDE2470701.1 flagellar biosynthetic protein FliO [Bradyrhizobium sp.]
MPQALTFFFAFVAVLALIGTAAWLLRRFAGNRLSTNTNRGRGPRLAVIDAAAVDGRRRLVLVRRDNVEHLLMIGGPTDIVVEPNIVRAMSARDQMGQRSSIGSEPPPRIAPLPDGSWSDIDGSRSDAFDHAEPQMPEPPQQLPRPPFADEARRSASPRLERRSDPLAGLSPEPLAPHLEQRDSSLAARPSRTEPMIPRQARQEGAKPPPIRAERPSASQPSPPPVPPPVPAPSSADQNLAEMAQRLEAALRRPSEPGEPRVGAPPVAPEPPGRTASRTEPSTAPPGETSGPKTGFENLEDEMASLLGRPKSPS